MRKVDFLLVFVPFVHRKIDDPAELEHTRLGETELRADARACGAGEFRCLQLLIAGEENGIPCFGTGLNRDLDQHFARHEFGDRSTPREPP